MKEIEEKIQQTQSNMEKMQYDHEKNRQKTREQIQEQKRDEMEKDGTLQMLTQMIKKQQDQIQTFMQGTSDEVYKMQDAIQNQGKIQEELAQVEPFDPKSPEVVEKIAAALAELQQNDRMQEEIKKIGQEIQQNQATMQEIKVNSETVKQKLQHSFEAKQAQEATFYENEPVEETP